MPTVFPGAPDPSHDISLSDGTLTYGFSFAGGPRVLQEIPLSPPASQFNVKQADWVGGRGSLNLSDDATGFFDSNNLWASSVGKITNAPQWVYGNGFRVDVDESSIASTDTLTWAGVYGTARYLADSYIASNSVAADKAYIHLRRIGTPGTLTLELCSDHATPGKPGTVLQTVTMAETVVPDFISVYKVFDWSGTQARTATTVYWIKVYGAAGDTLASHWEVLTGGTTGSITGSDNAAWGGTAGALALRVVGADVARKWYFFTLYSGLYAVSKNDDRSTSAMYMNGFRGIASGGSSTTLACAQACARDYTGAYIRIIDGTGDGQIRQIASNTTGGSVTFTVPTFDVTPDSTSIFVVYGTKFWDLVTGTHGLGYVVGQPAVTNNVAYIPQGTSVAVRRMRVNGNSHDFAAEATYKSDILYVNTDSSTATQIWGANVSTSQIVNANVEAWGTDLVVLATTSIGTSAFKITNMWNYDARFFIFKEDGLYTFDGTRVGRFGKNFESIADPGNGLAVSNDNTYLWWTWGHSAERMLGKNITDMLNWRAGYEGLPANRRGVITQIVSAIGWMFFVVDGGATNFSSVIYWNGYGWHELFRGHELGVRIRGAVWQSCPGTNPRLWMDVNGELMHIIFPLNTAVPVRDVTLAYAPEGVFISSTIDSGSIETYKIFKSIRIFQNTVVAQKIYVDYQINENVETELWVHLGIADTVPFEEMTMNLGAVTRLRFRLRLYAGTYRTSPLLVGWAISGREMPLPKYQYVGTYVASTDQDTKQGEPDVSSETTYAWLQAAAINQTKLTLRTLNTSSDSKTVTVSLPVKSVDWVDESSWGGRLQFSILEV